MPVRQRLAVQFGAAYSQKGEISSHLENFIEGPLIENRLELDYLELTMLGRVDFPLKSDGLHPHLLAGQAVAVLFSCREGRTTAPSLGDCGASSSQVGFLLTAGGGLDVRLSETLDATLGFLYGINLSATYGIDHLRTLTLRAGLVYRLN